MNFTYVNQPKEEINEKRIIAVKYATYTVARRKTRIKECIEFVEKNGRWQVSNLCSEGYALTPCATRTMAIMVRALHRYRRAQGSNSGKPKQLFQAFLS